MIVLKNNSGLSGFVITIYLEAETALSFFFLKRSRNKKNPSSWIPALIHKAGIIPIESARKELMNGATAAAKNCVLCAKEEKVELYSIGNVLNNSSKNTRSRPDWKIPESPAKSATR